MANGRPAVDFEKLSCHLVVVTAAAADSVGGRLLNVVVVDVSKRQQVGERERARGDWRQRCGRVLICAAVALLSRSLLIIYVCVCVLMRCLFLFLSPQLLSLLMLMPMLSPELLTATAIRGEGGGGDLWKAENNSLAN